MRTKAIDTWLSRFSSIAQILASAATVFLLFYAVIPIYQKELLSEAIAQKEVELSLLKKDVLEQEVRRGLGNFVAFSSMECGGLLIKISEDMSSNSNSDEFWKINTEKCIINVLNRVFDKDLPDSVMSQIIDDVGKIGLKLNAEKFRLKQRFDSLPFYYRLHPEVLPPIDGALKRMSDFLKEDYDSPVVLKHRIKDEQQKISSEFHKVIGDNLKDILSEKYIQHLMSIQN